METTREQETLLNADVICIKGAHVSVHIGCPNGLKSFGKEHFRNIEGETIHSDAAPTPIHILKSENLTRAATIAGQIRANLDSPLHSLQLAGLNTLVTGEGIGQGRRIKTRFIPLSRLAAFYLRHKTLEVEFFNARDAFVDNEYEEAIKAAIPKLQKDGLLEKIQWPDKEILRSSFYIMLDVRASSWENNLSVSLTEYAEETGKNEAEILQQIANLDTQRIQKELHTAVNQLASGLAANMYTAWKAMLDILTKKAQGDRTRLTTKRIDDFLEFFQAAKSINVTNNTNLNGVIAKIEDLLDTYGLDSPAMFKHEYDTNAEGLVQVFEEQLQDVEDAANTLRLIV